MDWESLTFALDYLVSTGTTFSTEQRLAIQASLCELRADNQFSRVQFWGRIQGVDADYYIVCGIGKDFIRDRTFFYSINNGLKWILLPPPTDLVSELGVAAKGRFIGDPTADSETECTANDSDEIEEGEQWAFIKEEERLAATVAAIQNEAVIVPRGALIKQPSGIVIENKTFTGLSKLDATQYVSYYHACRPRFQWDKNIVMRADYNIALDFLDSIALDLPAGSWAIQVDKRDSLTLISSLYWPGAVGYAVIGTPNYGWFYSGTGKKNWDVPWMILPPPDLNRAALLGGGDAGPMLYGEDAGESGHTAPAPGGDSSFAKAKSDYLKQSAQQIANQSSAQISSKTTIR